MMFHYVFVFNIQITTVPTCLSFQIEENVKIDEPKPGYVEVYDYYEKGKSTLSVCATYYL